VLTLVWSAEARHELRNILAFAERNATASRDLMTAIEACTERLSSHP
jgi:plasmid stabilization system protein ParE